MGIIILPEGQSYGRNKRYRVRTDYNVVMTQKTEINDGVTTTTDMIYHPTWQHHNAIETTVSNSDNIPYKTKTYYAHEMSNTNLTNRNMIGIPLKTEQYINSVLKSASQTIYNDFTTSLGTFPRPAQFQSLRRDGTTWDTKMTVNAYESTTGLPTSATRQGFIVPETYTWLNKLLTSKTFGGLVWNYEYKPNTNMVSLMIDENRLRTKFTYDALQRLQKVDNRMKDDGSDVQATMLYDYHYRTNTSDNNYVSTSTSFVNATNAPPLSTKQYMDGLGRPIKVVKENYTPIALQNQVNMVTYDNIGRQDRGYLPFESTGIGLVAGTPYSFPTYEASPLSRPLKQTNVDGTGVTMSYGTNAAADNIRNFVFTPVQGAAGTVTNNNVYYPAALFYKTTAWDENGTFLLPSTPTTTVGKTEMYKDKLGRTILTRKFLNGTNVDTYNVYDDYGSLVMVIPPGGLDANGNPIATLVFTYIYDSRNRLIEKKVPNADPQKFLYDNRDLLTLTQDGNMRNPLYGGAANKYLGTQYNTIGQVLKTGWVTDTTGLWAGNITITDANKLTEIQYYTNRTWVKHQAAKVLKPAGVSTVREYVWSYIERRVGYEYTGNPIWTGKQHLISKTYRYGNQEMGDGTIDDNDYGGVDWSVSAYNGLQKPTATSRNLYCDINAGSSARTVRTHENYTFDNAQRLTNLDYGYKIGGSAVTQSDLFNMSKMAYNYKDQVIEKNTALVAGKYLQSTDFAYNDRGWLTSINNGFLPSGLDYPLFSDANNNYTIMSHYGYLGSASYQTPPAQSDEHNPDLFTEKIRYTDPVYTFPGLSAIQRNGNITQIEWQVAGREAQAYSFKYDNLDRLTEANYTDIHSGNYYANGWSSQYETDNKFKEIATYDLRGNIQNLTRNGFTGQGLSYNNLMYGIFQPIDNLGYTYDPADLNKLTKVVDATNILTRGFKSATNNSTYAYDANGNLTSDLNKNITGITYNYLNLPLVISFTGNNRIEFIYDATGAKLRKTTYANNTLQETRDYVNGVEYKNGAVDRFAHTEGAVVWQTNSYQHEYTIKDHLGNARVTYSDGNNDGVITVADIKQINSYYPFGMNMEGNWNGAAGSNKYAYNSKEWNDDFGLGLNDYGARWYDPAIGRFGGVDILAEMYKRHSPNSYGFNNPIKFIDPTGMAPVYDWDAHNRGEKGVYKDENGDNVSWGSVKEGIEANAQKVQIHLVLKSKTPEIYDHTVSAIQAGHGFIFEFERNEKASDKRRREALKGKKKF